MAEFWCGVLVTAILGLITGAGIVVYWRKILLLESKEYKKQLYHESVRFAGDLAKQMFTEYVKTFVFNVRIDLVNESDIDWG